MFKTNKQKIGLYWQPIGGNNIDQYSAHSYLISDVSKDGATDILLDLGKYDNYQALSKNQISAAFPDVRKYLDGRAKALFLSHCHPDHINAIPHYIKLGYKLPPVYLGRFTLIILKGLFNYFNIKEKDYPEFVEVNAGDDIRIGSLDIKVMTASHTCFDSFGFYITSYNGKLYITGDSKLDSHLLFRKGTDYNELEYLKSQKIDALVADIAFSYRTDNHQGEIPIYKEFSNIIKDNKEKLNLILVYETHTELYLSAFLAAIKNKKDIIFYGNSTFYSFLIAIKDYGIDYQALANGRSKIYYSIEEAKKDNVDYKDFVMIGAFMTLSELAKEYPINANTISIINTSTNRFAPLIEQVKEQGINIYSDKDYPCFCCIGHYFLDDIIKLYDLVSPKMLIPTHAPDNLNRLFYIIAKAFKINYFRKPPRNMDKVRISDGKVEVIRHKGVNKWLGITYKGRDLVEELELKEIKTGGIGLIPSKLDIKSIKRDYKNYIKVNKKS